MYSFTNRTAALLLVILLQGCNPAPQAAVLAPPPTPTPAVPVTVIIPESEKPILAGPDKVPTLAASGLNLILEFEVGGRSGYNPHPESEHDEFSGITWGIGYDGHQNSKARILGDWAVLGAIPAQRLAAVQPYYGHAADAHLHEVRDILVSWAIANDVFGRVDLAREYANCRRAYKGFDELRPNAQAALISLGFNRGYSFVGDNRKEMRAIRDLVPKQDYAGMAAQFRGMVRVWRGKSIYEGMKRRRLAEAKLMETP